jgi:cyclase
MAPKVAFTVVCAAVFCLPLSAAAQQTSAQPRPAPAPMTVEKVKGTIYQVKGGSGANTGFFVGGREVVVVDAKMTEESARQMLEEIRKITPLPVTTLVLTHSDGDHVNGLVGFPPGLDILSHANTRDHMVKAFESVQQIAHLPTMTFTETMSLYFGDGKEQTRIDLFYFGPAHTNGDVIVYFPEEKVAFIGDLLFLGRDPLIHRAKNGTSFGLVNVLKALVNLNAETYVSGHNEVTTKKEIQDFLQSVQDKQAKVQAMINGGKSLDEVKKAFNIETPAGGSRWPSLVEVIYLELTEKKR